MTSLLAHGVRLTLVLGHASVNLLHDIRADRGAEDSRDGVGRARGLTIFADDRDGRSRSHCEGSGEGLEPVKRKKITRSALLQRLETPRRVVAE